MDVVLLNPRQHRHERDNNTSGVRQEDDMLTNCRGGLVIGRGLSFLSEG